MNWAEVLTIVTSIGALMGGLVMWLDSKHREDITRLDESRRLDISNHREDMKAMDERWKWLDSNHREEVKAMDERWKWLFERIETKLDQIGSKS